MLRARSESTYSSTITRPGKERHAGVVAVGDGAEVCVAVWVGEALVGDGGVVTDAFGAAAQPTDRSKQMVPRNDFMTEKPRRPNTPLGGGRRGRLLKPV
jgi:hypothetical protein